MICEKGDAFVNWQVLLAFCKVRAELAEAYRLRDNKKEKGKMERKIAHTCSCEPFLGKTREWFRR